MQKLMLFIAIGLIFLSLPSLAYTPREGNVSATLGPFFYETAQQHPVTDTSAYQTDMALIVHGDISDYGNLEISMFHMNKLFYRNQDGDSLEEQIQVMHISMGYRYWFSHYFSTALAFYSAYTMGDPQVIRSTVAAGHELETSARDTVEYGFDLSILSELWHKDNSAITLDARYSKSLTSKQNEHSDHYGLILGFRYFIQDRMGNRVLLE